MRLWRVRAAWLVRSQRVPNAVPYILQMADTPTSAIPHNDRTREAYLEALGALDECDALVGRLHKMCCEPNRSPEMIAIENALRDIRDRLLSIGAMGEAGILDELEAVGSRIGRLQVGCCAPARLPLYAATLSELNSIQLVINRVRGTGH